ncbi:hypothetical protein K474DRAFT_189841 [Panus rudis PR-1116 ss-1]|nr:hypothetical protein K474DRAFT_189841 [Panus rudis PR-1116 ss-1]
MTVSRRLSIKSHSPSSLQAPTPAGVADQQMSLPFATIFIVSLRQLIYCNLKAIAMCAALACCYVYSAIKNIANSPKRATATVQTCLTPCLS